MAFKDNFRIEKIYFQRVKDDAQMLAAWKNDARLYSDAEITRIAKDACDSILMLYRLIGEAWNDALNHIEKLSAELDALAAKTDAYHDELNEKIDEVNNYLNTQIKNLEIRVENIEDTIDDFGGLPSNEDANENDVLTVGPDHVNIWKRVSGLEILTLEWLYDEELAGYCYILKDPDGTPITTYAGAMSWYNKGAIVKVVSTETAQFIDLNYNSIFNETEPQIRLINPFVNMFLYPSQTQYYSVGPTDFRPIWTGYGAKEDYEIEFIPRAVLEFTKNNGSRFYSYDTIGNSIKLWIDGDIEGNYPIYSENSHLTYCLQSRRIPHMPINIDITKRTTRTNSFSTFDTVNYTKYDYVSSQELADLVPEDEPTAVLNTNGILIYLENGDRILGYVAENPLTNRYYDEFVYIKNEINITFHLKNLNDNTVRTFTYSKAVSLDLSTETFTYSEDTVDVIVPANGSAEFTVAVTPFAYGPQSVASILNRTATNKIIADTSITQNYLTVVDTGNQNFAVIILSNYSDEGIYLAFMQPT